MLFDHQQWYRKETTKNRVEQKSYNNIGVISMNYSLFMNKEVIARNMNSFVISSRLVSVVLFLLQELVNVDVCGDERQDICLSNNDA